MYGVIIPTYNERENVPVICELIQKTFDDLNLPYKIIFIDDASPDGTAKVIEDLKRKYPIICLKRKNKLGIGSAYKMAANFGTEFDFYIILDADLSQNPLDIKRFIKKQRETNCDLVYGTRYNSGHTVDWPFKRRLISRIANNLTKILLGIEITDFTNSFRLYRGSMFRVILPSILSEGFSFQMEAIYIAAYKNFKIEEVPIIFYKRNAGESKLGSNEVFQFLIALFSLFCRKIPQ